MEALHLAGIQIFHEEGVAAPDFGREGCFFGGLLNSHKKLPPGQQSNIRMASATLCMGDGQAVAP